MENSNEGMVYVVDDDLAVRESLSILLEATGIRTESYASAEKFLAAFDESKHCCLVLDARLPGMSGLDLLDRLSNEGRQVPVFMITGHGDAEFVASAENRGVAKCFGKPFKSDELVSSVERALGR